MSELVVVVFPDDARAREGLGILSELHREGSVTVFATALLHREPNGAVKLDERRYEGPVGVAVGTLVGMLIGLFGGPAGLVSGAASGALIGGASIGGALDLIHLGVTDEFLVETKKNLAPGSYALVAEIADDWTGPLYIRMESIGGSVVHEQRDDFTDELLERRADAIRRSFRRWETERTTARAEHMEERLDAEMARGQKRLQALAEKALGKLQERKAELNSKLEALEQQAAKATPSVRKRIDRRIAVLRRDFGERAEKLERAYELSTEALRPEVRA
jgi:uncharacterized membrane protein